MGDSRWIRAAATGAGCEVLCEAAQDWVDEQRATLDAEQQADASHS